MHSCHFPQSLAGWLNPVLGGRACTSIRLTFIRCSALRAEPRVLILRSCQGMLAGPQPPWGSALSPFGKPSSSSVGLGCASSLGVAPVARTGGGAVLKVEHVVLQGGSPRAAFRRGPPLAHWESWVTSPEAEGSGDSGGQHLRVSLPKCPHPKSQSPVLLTRALALAWSP